MEYIIGFAVITIVIIVWGMMQAKTQRETHESGDLVSVGFLKQNNFTVSKEIWLDVNDVKKSVKFVVDDYQKKFGLLTFDANTYNNQLQVWNYSALLDFNLFEDGDQMIPGRGLMAAGGGLLFGVTGAVIGSVAGDRKVKTKCNQMVVQIKVNDLNNPLVSLMIATNCEKSSFIYKNAKEKADQIIATLTYIEANKNTPPVQAPAL